MNWLYQHFLFPYVLKMLFISAVSFGYYQIFLRNRPFHFYNRIYLLISTLFALLLPLVQIPHPGLYIYLPQRAIQALAFPLGAFIGPAAPATTMSVLQQVPAILYAVVAAFLLFRLVHCVYQVLRLARSSHASHLGSIRLFEISGGAAPFSFLHWLFWDPALPRDEGHGRLIFLHESYHIRHKHTLDVLALEIVKAACWFNPFFYWTLRELKTLHEFAADGYAVSATENTIGKRVDYAELLVWQSVEKTIPVAHSFFNHQIKRRITMITQISLRPSGRLARIIGLPLLLLLTALFSTTPAQTQTAGPTAKNNQLIRWFSRHLKYPEQNLNAHKEGTIWFSVKMGESGSLLAFMPLDRKPAGHEMQQIHALSLQRDAKPGAPMSDEEARKFFMEDAQAAAEKMNSPHPGDGYLNAVPSGQYYFEIVYAIQK